MFEDPGGLQWRPRPHRQRRRRSSLTNFDDVTTLLRHKNRTTGMYFYNKMSNHFKSGVLVISIKNHWKIVLCFLFFLVTCHPCISRSNPKTRFLQKLIRSSVPLRSSLTSVLHLTTILLLVTATLAVPLAQAVKNEGHAAGGMAITAAAAANAGMATNIFFPIGHNVGVSRVTQKGLTLLLWS